MLCAAQSRRCSAAAGRQRHDAAARPVLFRIPVCAARTLDATGQLRVTLYPCGRSTFKEQPVVHGRSKRKPHVCATPRAARARASRPRCTHGRVHAQGGTERCFPPWRAAPLPHKRAALRQCPRRSPTYLRPPTQPARLALAVLGSWVKLRGTRLEIRNGGKGAIRLPRILVHRTNTATNPLLSRLGLRGAHS